MGITRRTEPVTTCLPDGRTARTLSARNPNGKIWILPKPASGMRVLARVFAREAAALL